MRSYDREYDPSFIPDHYSDSDGSRGSLSIGSSQVCSCYATQEDRNRQTPADAPVLKDYKIMNPLGEGGFGAVFQARGPDQQGLAIKVQRVTHDQDKPKLTHELWIYQTLTIDNRTGFSTVGIPRVYDYFEQEGLEFLVMEEMGQSLEAILKSRGLISKKSALMLGIQLVRRLETIHSHGILHRDIKPDNIVMGLGPNNERTVNLIDFGLASIVDNWENYDIDGKVVFAGTEYFASVEALYQNKPTRSGDLQSVGYTLVSMVVGELPWKFNDKGTGETLTYTQLGIQRSRIKPVELCKQFPELTQFMKAVRWVKRTDTPNYDKLVSILEEALQNMDCENDGEFEWLGRSQGESIDGTRVTSNRDIRNSQDAFSSLGELNRSMLHLDPPPGFEKALECSKSANSDISRGHTPIGTQSWENEGYDHLILPAGQADDIKVHSSERKCTEFNDGGVEDGSSECPSAGREEGVSIHVNSPPTRNATSPMSKCSNRGRKRAITKKILIKAGLRVLRTFVGTAISRLIKPGGIIF